MWRLVGQLQNHWYRKGLVGRGAEAEIRRWGGNLCCQFGQMTSSPCARLESWHREEPQRHSFKWHSIGNQQTRHMQAAVIKTKQLDVPGMLLRGLCQTSVLQWPGDALKTCSQTWVLMKSLWRFKSCYFLYLRWSKFEGNHIGESLFLTFIPENLKGIWFWLTRCLGGRSLSSLSFPIFQNESTDCGGLQRPPSSQYLASVFTLELRIPEVGEQQGHICPSTISNDIPASLYAASHMLPNKKRQYNFYLRNQPLISGNEKVNWHPHIYMHTHTKEPPPFNVPQSKTSLKSNISSRRVSEKTHHARSWSLKIRTYRGTLMSVFRDPQCKQAVQL